MLSKFLFHVQNNIHWPIEGVNFQNYLSWPIESVNVQSSTDFHKSIEGVKVALNDEGKDFFTACIEEIERRGLRVEGLYRRTALNQNMVLELLKEGLKKKNGLFGLVLDKYDTKVLTSSVKLFLNYLPEALLTVVVYPSIIQSVRSNDITELSNAVHKIPSKHFVFLEKLIQHLYNIVQHSPENLMTSKNMSSIFGQILLRPSGEDLEFAELATQMLIDNYHYIFNNGLLITQQPMSLNSSKCQRVKIFIGTWNVSNKPISEELLLNYWLHPTSGIHDLLPDIYAVGFQELDLSPETVLYDRSHREKEWLTAVRQCLETLSENYTQVEFVRMMGIMMVIYVRDSIVSYISNVDKNKVASGELGNKGGVSIRFELNKTSFCFICSHFAPHVKNVQARNEDFMNVLTKIHFKETNKAIPDHDVVFWFGDLNYRFDHLNRDTVLKLINRKNYDLLLPHDQLKNILNLSTEIFPGFKEPDIRFKPTYKYVPGTLDRLKISPKNGIIDPGQMENIVFTIQVTEKIAWKLNVGEESIEDKFYLRISEQKEKPIRINGVYQPSVFGFSMETLAKLTKPLTEMSFDELRAIELKEHPWIGDDSMQAAYPTCLWRLIDYLIQNSVQEEHLFLKEGNYFETINIRDWLDSEKDLSFLAVSAASIAQCILLLFKSTREPLIKLSPNNKRKMNPTLTDKVVVDVIIFFLTHLLRFKEQNKLTVNILADVFAVAIFHSDDDVSKRYMANSL
ncbi:hypothetical protein WDU94_007629 [Cyamophila willieti]